jgi:hypothetical protein
MTFKEQLTDVKTQQMAVNENFNHENKTTEQVSSFNYLGFNVSYCLKEDIKN